MKWRKACLSACLHITTLVGKSGHHFFPGCPPGTHILHLFHLFMTFLWPQTYAMSPREMEAESHFKSTCAAEERSIAFSCSPHSPQEIRNINVRTDMKEKKYEDSPLLFTFLPPPRSLSAEVLYHWQRCGVHDVHRIVQTGAVKEPVASCLSVLIKSNLKVSEHQKTLSPFFQEPVWRSNAYVFFTSRVSEQSKAEIIHQIHVVAVALGLIKYLLVRM